MISQLFSGHLMTDAGLNLFFCNAVASHRPLDAQGQRSLNYDKAVNSICEACLHKDGALHHDITRLTGSPLLKIVPHGRMHNGVHCLHVCSIGKEIAAHHAFVQLPAGIIDVVTDQFLQLLTNTLGGNHELLGSTVTVIDG